jgi:hypothetical protein
MLLRFVMSCALHVVARARILDGLDLAVNRKRRFSVIRSQTATSAQADDCFEDDQPTGSGRTATVDDQAEIGRGCVKTS